MERDVHALLPKRISNLTGEKWSIAQRSLSCMRVAILDPLQNISKAINQYIAKQ